MVSLILYPCGKNLPSLPCLFSNLSTYPNFIRQFIADVILSGPQPEIFASPGILTFQSSFRDNILKNNANASNGTGFPSSSLYFSISLDNIVKSFSCVANCFSNTPIFLLPNTYCSTLDCN